MKVINKVVSVDSDAGEFVVEFNKDVYEMKFDDSGDLYYMSVNGDEVESIDDEDLLIDLLNVCN